jgi:hypothetical protein
VAKTADWKPATDTYFAPSLFVEGLELSARFDENGVLHLRHRGRYLTIAHHAERIGEQAWMWWEAEFGCRMGYLALGIPPARGEWKILPGNPATCQTCREPPGLLEPPCYCCRTRAAINPKLPL